jgi:hypothetical protein
MARIQGVDPARAQGYVAKVLEAQARTWGAPLANHLVYARRPVLFKAVRGMWAAMDSEGLLGAELVHLVNRRVAFLNGCEF